MPGALIIWPGIVSLMDVMLFATIGLSLSSISTCLASLESAGCMLLLSVVGCRRCLSSSDSTESGIQDLGYCTGTCQTWNVRDDIAGAALEYDKAIHHHSDQEVITRHIHIRRLCNIVATTTPDIDIDIDIGIDIDIDICAD